MQETFDRITSQGSCVATVQIFADSFFEIWLPQKKSTYTLLRKKRNFSYSISPGDPGSGSVTRSITKTKIYHMTTDLQSSPKNETFKSCVSFEEECISVSKKRGGGKRTLPLIWSSKHGSMITTAEVRNGCMMLILFLTAIPCITLSCSLDEHTHFSHDHGSLYSYPNQ